MTAPVTHTAVQRAQQALDGGAEVLEGHATFPPAVNARLAIAGETASANAGKVDTQRRLAAHRLMDAALQGKTATKRLMWLHRAADAFSSAVAPHAACRPGCTHCCHIPVTVTAAEAVLIGKATGVAPVQHPASEAVDASYENPCPFLVDSRCSIYAVRPTVCRAHFNLDADALLCELTPGGQVPVPLADNRALMLTAAQVAGHGGLSADIRRWFPKASTLRNPKRSAP